MSLLCIQSSLTRNSSVETGRHVPCHGMVPTTETAKSSLGIERKKNVKRFIGKVFFSIHPPYMSEIAGCTSSGLAKLHKGLPVDLLASVPRWIKEVAIFKKLRRVKSSVVPFEWQSGKDWGVKSKMEKISWMFWQNCGTDAVCRV